MKAAPVKKQHLSSGQLQEAFETLYDELCGEFAKVQANARKFRQARPGTEMYDQAWANFYVSLNVLETKARSLQEVLDQISEQLNNGEN